MELEECDCLARALTICLMYSPFQEKIAIYVSGRLSEDKALAEANSNSSLNHNSHMVNGSGH